MIGILLAGIFMSLPALLCLQPLWKQLRKRQFFLLISLCLVGLDYLRYAFGEKLGLVPFWGNILTPVGILDLWIDGLGFRSLLWSKWLRYGITFFLIFCIAAWIYFVNHRSTRGQFPRTPMTIFILFACTYIPLLFPGALMGFSYDRYVLPLLPLLIISILLPVQHLIKQVPVAAWTCLLLFATYGIVTTHDYFAALRARAEATQELIKRSIPEDHASIGLERDAWLQLQLTGKIKPTLFGDNVRFDLPNKYWLWFYTKAIQPDYVAVSARMDALPRGKLFYVPFTTWTPPFRRAIAVVKREDLPSQ